MVAVAFTVKEDLVTIEQVRKIQRRAGVDPIMRALMSRLAQRTAAPTFTKESAIRHFAVAKGVETTRKQIRNIVLFLSEIDVAEFVQEPENRFSAVRWKVDAIQLAKRVMGELPPGWSPSDDELQAFMASL